MAHHDVRQKDMKIQLIALIAVVVLVSACNPTAPHGFATHRVAPGTDLILPRAGSGSLSRANGKTLDAQFEGEFGKIKIRGTNLYLSEDGRWAHYSEIQRFYRIEWRDGILLFDGKKIDPVQRVTEIE